MNKRDIQKKYLDKLKLIEKYNQNYYEKSKPLVDDRAYDSLKREILNLETKFPFLKSENSPSKTIGYKPSKNFTKSLHKVPMLSLANAFTEEDLLNFEKKILNFLSKDKNYQKIKIQKVENSILKRFKSLFN